MAEERKSVCLYAGDELKAYSFGATHPFNAARLDAFMELAYEKGLLERVSLQAAEEASVEAVTLFHTKEHIEAVRKASILGRGWLDAGDTPAFPGVFRAALRVVGASLSALHCILQGRCKKAFVPIGGLHHASPESSSGFCVFNDCGVVIADYLQKGEGPIAYVDIDAHHGDGVYYGFADQPEVVIADIHEDGRFLYPGTGSRDECGLGAGKGSKLNLPLPPGAGDREFFERWREVELFIASHRPRMLVFQCGADGMLHDPLTHLCYTKRVYIHAAASMCRLAERFSGGKLLVLGGGGYHLPSLAEAWCAVLEVLIKSEAT